MDKGIVITKEMLDKGNALEATKSKTNSTSYDAIFLNGKERIVDKKHPAEVLNWREKNSKTYWLGKDNFNILLA